MGLHTRTVNILEDKQLCDRILDCLKNNNYSKVWIQDKFDVSRHEISRILEMNNNKQFNHFESD